MYGIKNLKPKIKHTSKTVECPVLGCNHHVPRMTRADKKTKQLFLCKQHGIFITPSTFIYMNESDNLLWKGKNAAALLKAIHGKKVESRIAHDNSEDAVTWNVFYHLYSQHILADYLVLVLKPLFFRVVSYKKTLHSTGRPPISSDYITIFLSQPGSGRKQKDLALRPGCGVDFEVEDR